MNDVDKCKPEEREYLYGSCLLQVYITWLCAAVTEVSPNLIGRSYIGTQSTSFRTQSSSER